MEKGAKSFTEFAVAAIPAVVAGSWLVDVPAGILSLIGIFIVLQFANRLDSRP